jgi:hypothetical protein
MGLRRGDRGTRNGPCRSRWRIVRPSAGADIAGLLRSRAGKQPDCDLLLVGSFHSFSSPRVVAVLLQPLCDIATPNETSPADLEGRKLTRLEELVELRRSEAQPKTRFLNG